MSDIDADCGSAKEFFNREVPDPIDSNILEFLLDQEFHEPWEEYFWKNDSLPSVEDQSNEDLHPPCDNDLIRNQYEDTHIINSIRTDEMKHATYKTANDFKSSENAPENDSQLIRNHNITFSVQNGSFVPTNDTYPPQNGQFIPQNGPFTPNYGTFMNLNDSSHPQTGQFIPKNDSFIPHNGQFTPSYGTFMNQNDSSLPQTGQFMPFNRPFIPQSDSFTHQNTSLMPQNSLWTSNHFSFNCGQIPHQKNYDVQNPSSLFQFAENQMPITDKSTRNNPQNKLTHKQKYGKGFECQKLTKNYNHMYKKPYKHFLFYKAVKRSINSKRILKKILEIGNNYNKHFKVDIDAGHLPNFNRDMKRNMGVAVHFFENILCSIINWLITDENLLF